MPLCNNLDNDLYYFNTKPEIIAEEIKSVFSSLNNRSKYKVVCHILKNTKEVFFTIVKQTAKNKHKFIASFTDLRYLNKYFDDNKLSLNCVGIIYSYSINTKEVIYYD